MKSFFRKVSFGLGPAEEIPSDPLKWAQNQLDEIPKLYWKGKIYTEKELRKFYGDFVYGKRIVLKEEYYNDKKKYKEELNKLRHKNGLWFWVNLELSIRHTEAIYSSVPVLTKLWYFWCNHFALSNRALLANFSTGAYHRETIRSNLNQHFEKMAFEATTSWPMIFHLDNSKNIGPNSKDSKSQWRIDKNRPATINENHARELLELHTVSTEAGYTQEDIINMAYIMSGWRYKYDSTNLLETADVIFSERHHQPGKKIVLKKEYQSGKNALSKAIKDLADHPSCREFIAMKLCRYLITDYPTKEMINPIVKAWKESDGYLPEVHKAAIEVAFNYSNKYQKFQNPENWYLQMVKMCDIKYPPKPEIMDTYTLGNEPNHNQKSPARFLKDLGCHPYLAIQVNGWSDISTDWMSPELIIRRLIYAKKGYFMMQSNNQNNEFYEKLIKKNFNNPNQILNILKKQNKLEDKHTLLFNLPEVLKS